jgi:hypothetical protein
MTRDFLVGHRFGRLIVQYRAEDGKRGQTRWSCRCDCGSDAVVRGGHLKSGLIRSCGCLRRETTRAMSTTHGASGDNETATYRTWRHMRERCDNPRNKDFPDYGGRGIRVCDRWRSYENFLADLGERPPGTSIDRIDNNKGYEIGNVHWASSAQQAQNRRSTKLSVDVARSIRARHSNGETLASIARDVGVSRTMVRNVVHGRAWSSATAVSG